MLWLRGLIAALLTALVTTAGAQLSMTGVGPVGSGAGGPTPPLDGLTAGLEATYSTRKMLSAYAGSAIRVLRASDSAQQDIGFTAGSLNTSSLSTFCSGTSCTVVTWYDQSGNGANAVTPSTGPTIYSGGAVKTLNTKPAPLWDGSTNKLSAAGLTTAPVNTYLQNSVILYTTVVAANKTLISCNPNGPFTVRINTTAFFEGLSNFVALRATANTTIPSGGTGHVAEFSFDGTNWVFWVDGAATGTTGAGTISGNAAPRTFGYNGFGNNEFFEGLWGEYISYDVAGGLSNANRQFIEANQKTYWGTP